jgi:ribosomal-protein-alanine N-acetyltransferase
MTKRYTIREMRREDIGAILGIERRSFPTPWTEWMFVSHLKFTGISVNLVLETGEGISGYAIAWVAYDEIHLLSIAVGPEHRRLGYGRALIEEIIRCGRARGGSLVVLEVREGNEPARNFYKNMGFEVIGKRKRYYIDTGEDAFVMVLSLRTGMYG